MKLIERTTNWGLVQSPPSMNNLAFCSGSVDVRTGWEMSFNIAMVIAAAPALPKRTLTTPTKPTKVTIWVL